MTEKTWEAFEARWGTLQTEALSHAEDILNHMVSIPREFGLQQLENATNYFALAFSEIEKCIFYEQSNLAAEIGPKIDTTIPVAVSEEASATAVTDPVDTAALETASPPPLFKPKL